MSSALYTVGDRITVTMPTNKRWWQFWRPKTETREYMFIGPDTRQWGHA